LTPRIGFAAVALILLAAPSTCRAWGARMHEIINRKAAEMCPGAARAAWGPFAASLGAHASDADHRKSFEAGESLRHFLDIDAWGEHPFDDVPRAFEDLARKHGTEEAKRFGIVPWAIDECYRMLVLSLRRGDWSSAGAWAADLGHYVADSHQPLHCTVNYDGQGTGNRGIHLRFEVTMMDRFFREEWIPEPSATELPEVTDGPIPICFEWIAGAYPDVTRILAADDAAKAVDPDHGDRYYEALWEGTRELAVLHMTRSVHDLAALYAAAWEEAGAPPPPAETPAFRALSVSELEPPPPGPSVAPRGAIAAALAAILAALAFGSR
jgi:hypothetical protein